MFSSSDGTHYDGGWSGDHITGKGRMTYSNGDCYDGNWFKNTVSTLLDVLVLSLNARL